MIVFVEELDHRAATDSGVLHRARVFAAERERCWEAWIVFEPVLGGDPLPSDVEVTQPTLEAVTYWASTLSPRFVDGALGRALARAPEEQIDRTARIALREEAAARAEADAHER
nr:hypothetical protein [Myxococcota bacterium]